jgi:hypothetical protein
MATTSRQNLRWLRWLPSLAGIAVLSVGWAAIAVVTAHEHGATPNWANRIAAELSLLNRSSPSPAVAPEPTVTAAPRAGMTSFPQGAAVPATAAFSRPPDAIPSLSCEIGSASDENAPPVYPRPIVVYVERAVQASEDQAAAAPQATSTPVGTRSAPALALASAASASAPPPAPAAPQPVACGATQCAPGMVCCNASCGTCVNPGERCSQHICGMPVPPESATCGPNTCNVDQVCCNESCGICVHPGDPCDATRRCSDQITYGESQSCGMQTCNVGLICCNPTCGLCVRPGESCSQRVCK